MLTISKVSSDQSAASYYENSGEYYIRDDPSIWQGEGAERLQLKGVIDFEIFKNLINGKLPDGSEIHNVGKTRCAALDLTFSAPKSISMQSLIGGDKGLIKAHEVAVSRALEYAQTLAAYRVTKEGITVKETSGNFTIATFLHDLSRANDPNLHTHSVLLNITQRADGQWRSLEQTELYRQKMLMGALYRSELAQEVKKLGYEVRITHADGRFELAHISGKQIEAFSTRSQQIESMLASRGLTRESATSREKEISNLASRDAKGEVDREALMMSWLEKSLQHGVSYSQPSPLKAAYEANSFGAKDAVSYAVEHATERQSIVAKHSLIRAALEYGTGNTNLDAIQVELDRRVELSELIRSGERFTTEAAIKRELNMTAIAKRGRLALSQVLSIEAASERLSNSSLSPGQCAAAQLILTAQDRVVAVQGSAGTGKTFMLEMANSLAESEGFRVYGLAPSAAAVKELEKVGIKSQTIAGFEVDKGININEKTILLVDESGMVSAKDMHFILQAVELSNCRVVLLGDVQQLQAVEAGRPFAQLQESGISRVEMGEIQRQTDRNLRSAVELASQGEISSAIDILDKHIREIADDRTRYGQIAKDYVALGEEGRAGTLIVAGTRSACSSINHNIRLELDLAGNGAVVSTLERKDLTQAQAKMSTSYQAGDVVEAQKEFISLGMRRGDLATVVQGGGGIVRLERADGINVDWRPAVQTNMLAYKLIYREFSTGDLTRFTSNDYSTGITNGDRAIVSSIDQENHLMSMLKMDGSSVILDLNRPSHLDYAYCTTVHSSQGQTTHRVLIEADTTSLTSNENSFYVAISRAQSAAVIYTDDKCALPDAMCRESIKEAALDLPNEKPAMALDF